MCVCVCVCVRERERERECVCVCERESTCIDRPEHGKPLDVNTQLASATLEALQHVSDHARVGVIIGWPKNRVQTIKRV